MLNSDVESIVTVLKNMARLELAIGRFYSVCAECMDEDRDFWLDIVRQEESHAKTLYKMYTIIIARPERFEKGRPFNPTAITTFTSSIEAKIESLRKGCIPKKNIYIYARDIENSLLEDRFFEIVKTDDVEYQTLAKSIVSETSGHKALIQEKIRTL